MRKLIEFLLTRMDTHPEEFLQNRKPDVKHNWVHIIKDNKKFMTDDEYKAIWEKFSEINMEQAIEDVTNKLFEPVGEEWIDEFKSMPAGSTLSRTQVDMIKHQMEHQRELMKIELEARRFIKGEL